MLRCAATRFPPAGADVPWSVLTCPGSGAPAICGRCLLLANAASPIRDLTGRGFDPSPQHRTQPFPFPFPFPVCPAFGFPPPRQAVAGGGATALLRAAWSAHCGCWCRAVNWDRLGLEELVEIARYTCRVYKRYMYGDVGWAWATLQELVDIAR